MKINPYGVYVKTDFQNRITAVNSDAFLPSTDGWTKIDEGFGDKYHHAQGNYFQDSLYDDRGICRYNLVDGQPVERSREEMDGDYVEPVPVPTQEQRLTALEEEISTMKAAYQEGVASA